jgi:phenylacetate-CoA ligase
MIIVRGVSLYPSQVAAVLQSVEGTGARYQIVVDRPGALDEIEVAVELAPGVAADSAAALLSLQQELAKRLHAALNLTPKVRLVEPRSLEQQEGGRVIDRRAF